MLGNKTDLACFSIITSAKKSVATFEKKIFFYTNVVPSRTAREGLIYQKIVLVCEVHIPVRSGSQIHALPVSCDWFSGKSLSTLSCSAKIGFCLVYSMFEHACPIMVSLPK